MKTRPPIRTGIEDEIKSLREMMTESTKSNNDIYSVIAEAKNMPYKTYLQNMKKTYGLEIKINSFYTCLVTHNGTELISKTAEMNRLINMIIKSTNDGIDLDEIINKEEGNVEKSKEENIINYITRMEKSYGLQIKFNPFSVYSFTQLEMLIIEDVEEYHIHDDLLKNYHALNQPLVTPTHVYQNAYSPVLFKAKDITTPNTQTTISKEKEFNFIYPY